MAGRCPTPTEKMAGLSVMFKCQYLESLTNTFVELVFLVTNQIVTYAVKLAACVCVCIWRPRGKLYERNPMQGRIHDLFLEGANS